MGKKQWATDLAGDDEDDKNTQKSTTAMKEEDEEEIRYLNEHSRKREDTF